MSSDYRPGMGHMLDRARHNDPKLKKALRGVGSRSKQHNVAAEKGIRMPANPTDRINMNISGELKERFERLQGKGGRVELIRKALDAYEFPATATVSQEDTEITNILAAIDREQKDLGTPNRAVTLGRILELSHVAVMRAKRIQDQQREIDALRAARDQLLAQGGAQGAHSELEKEGEEALFAFVDAFKGTTVRADESGRVVVDIKSPQLVALFTVFANASRIIGLTKE